MPVKEPALYPEPGNDNSSREALLPEQKRLEHALPNAPPPHKVVLFSPHPGQVRHLKWRLTKYFADRVDILHMFAEMGIDKSSEIVLATGPGCPPAVWVRTVKTVRCASRTLQKPNPQRLGGPNPDPYLSTCRFCRVWLALSVPISGSGFRVFLFMVAFRYPTVNHKILTFANH